MNVCFLCGLRGKSVLLRTIGDSDTPHTPYFPQLLANSPAPQALPPDTQSGYGHIDACILCASILNEQWTLYESKNIPVMGRQYWTKTYSLDYNNASSPTNTTQPTCALCKGHLEADNSKSVDCSRLRNISQYKQVCLDTESRGGNTVQICNTCIQDDSFKMGTEAAKQTEAGSSRVDAAQMVTIYQLMMQQLNTGANVQTSQQWLQLIQAANIANMANQNNNETADEHVDVTTND